MTMTFKQRVADARNQQEALAAIAEGLDLIIHNIQPQPQPDPWDDWTPATPIKPDAAEKIKAAIAECDPTDEGMLRALQASLRLAQDSGQAIDLAPPPGRRETVIETDDDVNITVLVPTKEQYISREQFALSIKLGPDLAPPLEPLAAAAAYCRGGPTWLYGYDRAFVVSMPVNWKQALIADVEQDSTAMAQEMARDILKSGGPGEPDITLQAVNS